MPGSREACAFILFAPGGSAVAPCRFLAGEGATLWARHHVPCAALGSSDDAAVRPKGGPGLPTALGSKGTPNHQGSSWAAKGPLAPVPEPVHANSSEERQEHAAARD